MRQDRDGHAGDQGQKTLEQLVLENMDLRETVANLALQTAILKETLSRDVQAKSRLHRFTRK